MPGPSTIATPPTSREALYGLPVELLSGPPRPCAEPCPVCGEPEARPHLRVADVASPVVVCGGCGLARFDPLPEPDRIGSWYPDAYYGGTGRKFVRPIEWFMRKVGDRHLRFLSRALPPGARVLDVGCGRGVILSGLADRGLEVHGMEISERAAQGADPRAQIRIAGDLVEAGYPADGFDEVVIWHVLEHVSAPRECLLEVRRILKPGGRLVVAVPNFSSLQSRWFGPDWFHLDLPRHLHHFPRAALHRLLRDVGFTIEGEHHFSLRQNPFGWIQSLQNRWPRLPRNGLYQLLHRVETDASVPGWGWGTRALLYASAALLLPVGLMLSVLAAAFRSGATVHFVAHRPAAED